MLEVNDGGWGLGFGVWGLGLWRGAGWGVRYYGMGIGVRVVVGF